MTFQTAFWQPPAILGEREEQFSPTRAGRSTHGAQKTEYINHMKILFAMVVLGGVLLLAGCANTLSNPVKEVQRDTAPATTAPPDKSLVNIHRPLSRAAWGMKSHVWDGEFLIAIMASGNSTAYICNPGPHAFLSISFDQQSVVEGTLSPGRTYDLWIDPGSHLAPTLKLKPVKAGSREQTEVARWARENIWITRTELAVDKQREEVTSAQKVLQEFLSGRKKQDVQHLAPEDHR